MQFRDRESSSESMEPLDRPQLEIDSAQRQPAAGQDLCRRRSGCRRLGVGLVHISIYLALVVEHLESARPTKQEAA